MSNTINKTIRYSVAELEEFKVLIEQQLEQALIGHNRMQSQVDGLIDQVGDGSDLVDESSRGNDLEMLYMMLSRSRKHLQDLENALLRIQHKSYGICTVTGDLIAKRRLLAVPTTTKSLQGKQVGNIGIVRSIRTRRTPSNAKAVPQIISKIILKPSTLPKQEEEIDDFDQFLGGLAGDVLDDNLGIDHHQIIEKE